MKLNSGRFWLKTAVFSLASLALFVVLFFSLLLWQFDADSAHNQIEHALDAQHRRIKVSGAIRPILWPFAGIAANDVTISEPNSDLPFAAAKRIELGFDWWPLLRNQHVLSKVTLSGLVANVIRLRDGSLNLSDLLNGTNSPSFALDINNLKLRDTDLFITDHIRDTRLEVHNTQLNLDGLPDNGYLSLRGKAVHLGRSFSIDLNTPLQIVDNQLNASDVTLEINTTLPQLDNVPARLILTGATQWNFARQQLNASSVHATLETKQPDMGIEAEADTLTLDPNALSIPQLDISARMVQGVTSYTITSKITQLTHNSTWTQAHAIHATLGALYDQQKLTLTINSPLSFDSIEHIKLAPLTMQAQLNTPLLPRGQARAQIAGEVNANLNQEAITLAMNGLFDGAPFAITGTQTGFANPKHAFDVKFAKLDLNRYLPAASPETQALLQSKQRIDLDWLGPLNFTGTLGIDQLNVGRFAMQNVAMHLAATRQRLAIDKMQADIYQGRLNGSLTLDNSATPTLRIKQRLSKMSIAPLLKDVFNFGRVEGNGNVMVNITAQGRTFDDMRQTLGGRLNLSLNQGALTGINLVEALKNLPAELSHWSSQPLSSNATQKTPFQRLHASFDFEHGVGRNQDLQLNSNLIDLSGKGKIDLNSNIVDYALDVRANPGEFPQLNGLNVPLKITGSFYSPVFALDFNALVKDKKTDAEKQQALKTQLSNQFNALKP